MTKCEKLVLNHFACIISFSPHSKSMSYILRQRELSNTAKLIQLICHRVKI